MNDRAIRAESGFGAHTRDDFDAATAEHISMGDDSVERENGARTVRDRVILKDALRGREVVLTFYEEGFLQYAEKRRGKRGRPLPIDLRYLDPTPTVERHYPDRVFKTGCAAGAVTLITGALAFFGTLPVYMAATAAFALSATIVAGIACVYLSHECIRFYTQHGRAVTLELTPGVGSIGRYHAMLPNLISAIEEAGEDIGEDTSVYLRSEMREHYRLKNEGVLSEQDCSDSTARILAHFDNPI